MDINIAWSTDPHLNFISKQQALSFCEDIIAAEADLVILSGDIAESHSLPHWLQWLNKTLPQPIYYVLGNHDYYGSDIAMVRQQVTALQTDSLRWLNTSGVVELTPNTALVGHDGWADARYGDFMRSPVMLHDYFKIADLLPYTQQGKDRLMVELHKLGDQAAAELQPYLLQVLSQYPQVLVVTHIPPFKEACWHEGEISNDDWLPGFTCKAMGEMVLQAAKAYPQASIKVLCGHTHGAGVAKILPNLEVLTGAAEYGQPSFRLLSLAGLFVNGDQSAALG